MDLLPMFRCPTLRAVILERQCHVNRERLGSDDEAPRILYHCAGCPGVARVSPSIVRHVRVGREVVDDTARRRREAAERGPFVSPAMPDGADSSKATRGRAVAPKIRSTGDRVGLLRGEVFLAALARECGLSVANASPPVVRARLEVLGWPGRRIKQGDRTYYAYPREAISAYSAACAAGVFPPARLRRKASVPAHVS